MYVPERLLRKGGVRPGTTRRARSPCPRPQGGLARLFFVIPKTAKGKLLEVKTTITAMEKPQERPWRVPRGQAPSR